MCFGCGLYGHRIEECRQVFNERMAAPAQQEEDVSSKDLRNVEECRALSLWLSTWKSRSPLGHECLRRNKPTEIRAIRASSGTSMVLNIKQREH